MMLVLIEIDIYVLLWTLLWLQRIVRLTDQQGCRMSIVLLYQLLLLLVPDAADAAADDADAADNASSGRQPHSPIIF